MANRQEGEPEPLRIQRTAKTLRELALEKMRDAILRFRFRPGDRLIERELCDRLGVSRSVVREVLRHLEAEGLVESVPHHGPVVARFDPAKVEQIYEVRALLEAMAAAACAERADREVCERLAEALNTLETAHGIGDTPMILEATTTFYERLFESARKEVAWEIVNSLNARINHLRSMTITSTDRPAASIAEMRAIQRAIARGDTEGAYEAAREHVVMAARTARQFLQADDGGGGTDEGR